MDKGSQFPEPKAKAKRRIGYSSASLGITYCNNCAKFENFKGSDFEPIHNTSYNPGDSEFCTGSCGKAIYGKKKDYDG
jgi:hypothetical protein